jgi:hypothetical protein
MKNWYSGIYNSLIIASIISFIIYFFSSGDTSLGAILCGYSLILIALIMIIYIVLYNLMLANQESNFLYLLLSMIMTCGPFLLMLYVIGFVLYLIIQYRDKIILSHVSGSYFTFTNITILMIVIQTYLLYNNINNDKFEKTKTLSKVTSSLLFLFGVIAAISSMTLFTVLNKFTADG